MGFGRGYDTFIEIFALWGLVWFAKKQGFMDLRVVGYSKVIIDWVNGNSSMHSMVLHHWLNQVQTLI